MLTKTEAQVRLKRLGAFWLANMDDQHELWGSAWGFAFWVPIAGHRGMYEVDLIEVEDELRASKPPQQLHP